MEVICAILVALFGIGFGIFMALQPEDAIALRSRGRYTQVPDLRRSTSDSPVWRASCFQCSVLCFWWCCCSRPNKTLQLSSCGFFLILLQ